MNKQLKFWTGEFGDRYWRRHENQTTKENIAAGVKAYRRILKQMKVRSVLEVGCNIGIQLVSLRKLLDPSVKLYGVEPNKSAFSHLVKNKSLRLSGAYNCNAAHLPFKNNSIDLVFTSGVLIHIAPKNLLSATKEIVRVAKQYVLCVEYFSHAPSKIVYRGNQNVAFKQDFGGFYLDHFPTLKLVDYGFFWMRELPLFDDMNWWLFKKT